MVAPAGGGDEFDIIARCFAPLAHEPGARGLLDDVSILAARSEIAVTADAIVEGVHFLPDDPLDLVARKALRVNLSDLAAKGARPLGYLLTLMWPDTRPAEEILQIAAGLAVDQALFDVSLLGGDTVRTPGPLTVAITAFGRLDGPAPSRAGAQEGDGVWVSGTIGDGALGLRAARGESDVSAELRDALAARYRLPNPRLDLRAAVAMASASMDISDGLAGDAGKIAAASGVRLDLQSAAIPLSPAAREWLVAYPDDARLIHGGDDYELLLTAPPDAAAALSALGLTKIGTVTAGAGVTLDGGPAPQGFVHRLGA